MIAKKIVMLALSLKIIGCTMVTVQPGEEAVLFDKPWFFGTGGVKDEPLKTGRYFTWFTTSFKSVDLKPQRIAEPFDDLMSSDTVPVDFDTAIQLQVIDSVTLVKKYGDDWYANNLQRQYQSLVRDEAKKYSMNELLTGKDVPAAMENNIRRNLDLIIKNNNLPIKVTDLLIGRALPNKNVLAQIDETAAQQQRAKTMIEATKAEEQRKRSEAARAAADNAYRKEMNLDASEFIKLEQIKRFAESCGKSSCTLIIGDTANVAKMIK